MTSAYEPLAERLTHDGIDIEAVKARLRAQEIETPSWGYADSGTRFGVFNQPGAAVTIEEKLADAAMVHRMTGVAPLVAVHVLWDFPEGAGKSKQVAESLGVQIGAINPNCFQDQEYKLGSICSPFPESRQKAVDHMLDSVEIGKELGSDRLSLWFADGTSYPGQDDFRDRKHRMEECLRTVYAAMPPQMTMLLEYKLYEPGFYHTDLADWGMSYVTCLKLGDRAKVLVDLGHHAHSVNIEHIVAFLLSEERLGGFHFNNRKYGDDDLTVASINPYEFFLICNELVAAEDDPTIRCPVSYGVDQSHNLKPKILEMVQTVVQIQTNFAKALIVPRAKLREAQLAGDIVAAESLLIRAFNTDVEPLLVAVREELGAPPDPLQAYRQSGYQEKIAKERGIRAGAGLGT